jgi:molybdate transport repressor ModE-like protein
MTDELRHFLLLVEAGTFTAAARAAHLSQPALSASIARLERWAGASLLERRVGRAAGPGALLTAAGRALLPRARAVLAALADGQRAVGEVMGLVTGEVAIGAGATLCTYVLPRLLPGFTRAHPGLLLKLSEQTAAETRRGIDAGTLDLGLMTDVTGEAWISDRLVLVAHPKHPVALARQGLTPGTPLITFRPGGTTRELLEQHFAEARVVRELSGVAAVVAFVRAGAGVALVSRDAVSAELARGQLALIKDRRTPIVRPIHVCHRGVERLPPAAAALRTYLLEQAGKAYGTPRGVLRARRP